MTIFIRERKIERGILAQLLIDPDDGEVFWLFTLNMSIESAMEKKIPMSKINAFMANGVLILIKSSMNTLKEKGGNRK